MCGNYHGLPPAASVQQAIVLAQLLIVRDLERRTAAIPERLDQGVIDQFLAGWHRAAKGNCG
jgi:hypothetical protein